MRELATKHLRRSSPSLLASAKVEGPDWYAAVCLAGEAGPPAGEVKAQRWREDVDLIAKTITVNHDGACSSRNDSAATVAATAPGRAVPVVRPFARIADVVEGLPSVLRIADVGVVVGGPESRKA